MMEIWQAFLDFWALYGPWIATALIPTIVTGLSLSPKTAPGAPFVQKIWDKIKMVMDFLSVLTHKDKPGTFQLPLKVGKVISKSDNGSSGPAAALVFVVLFGSLYQVNCDWITSGAKEGGKIAIDCTVKSASEKAGDLLPAVMAILYGADSWKEQLSALGKDFGRDALACAIALAEERLFGQIPPQGMGDLENPDVVAFNRAREYTRSQDWVFVE